MSPWNQAATIARVRFWRKAAGQRHSFRRQNGHATADGLKSFFDPETCTGGWENYTDCGPSKA
jgi:hypothetical protein